MGKYYFAAQSVMLVIWMVSFVVDLPISIPLWVTFLPFLAFLLHLGIVIGILIVTVVVIGILARGQRKTFYH